ncbi:disease resistance protein RPM1-like protein [Cinnamomum micranthum f. kanehirae]|uniref:Disease resistance protein RPM1-like protein n=1 Tax=Cinnamomum micranthum f. kanehirae TaxID=337451 RepID=A0A3S4N8I7_9MAGN|nr:disease resistance protein RPM1-like protein [Cinnamomum micranthum f. kanehirae]
MAATAVGFLLQTLGSLVQHEASLLQGFRTNINEIQLELQSMRSFLKDADRRERSDDDDGVRTWVEQVREATYKVEDIIDMYMWQTTKQNTREGLIRRALYNTLLLPKNYCYKRQIASELQAIISEIHEISERRQRYGFHEEGQTSKMKNDNEDWQRSGEYLHFIPDEEIVGIDEDKDFLIGELTDERPKRVVVAVVGMGGLGKTTLVTKVYDSPQVKNHFECHAWITVSQSYKVDDLMRNMIKELYESNKEAVPDGIDKMVGGHLVQTTIDYLQNKRYVIVLDDVWETIDWNHIRVAFPNNRCGSRIMLTTRIRDVALSFEAESILYLEPLGKDEAWLLFCSRAFSNKSCPPELKPYAKTLVQKCEGLPLAIVTIGGLMLTKEKSSLEWRKVENSLSWQLSNNKKLGRMKNILLLNFDDLPYNLKYCFLYFGLFPEDCRISEKKLIKLWVAEGFIEEREGHTLEEVAEDYIKELTCRSMLQIMEEDFLSHRWVRMHDVLRELAISIGHEHEQNFCSMHDGKEEIWTNKAHYLSLQNNIVNIQSSSTCHPRSLMLFKIEIRSLSLNSISSRYKLLKVLNLESSSIESVPDELVELFNLRYLDLSKTNVEELPRSIGRLQNLQTLHIGDTKIKILPKGVGKLKKLRHAFISSGVHAPDGIFNLNCLQSLSMIGINDDTIRKVGNLTQLRCLGIENVKRNHGKELSASLQKMKALLNLSVEVISAEEILDLDAVSSPPAHLKYLWLDGRLERLPPWIGSLQYLVSLALLRSHLKEDPLSSLEALPNLMTLRLIMAYVGEELCFRHGCFLRLKVLAIYYIPKLNIIKIENGSMTRIEKLFLKECPELRRIPEGLQYLTTLQELGLIDMSEELIQRIKAGDELVNLLHIPLIGHYNSTNNIGEKIEIQAPIGDEEDSWSSEEQKEKERNQSVSQNMAEAAVGFLLQTLGSLVQHEASLLRGFRTNINEIRRELQSMRSFLKDADRRERSDDDDGARTWVEQVREATYKVEDIIDMYMWQIAKQHTGGGLIRRALYNTLLLPKHYCYKRQIASKLQAIKSEIHEISERRQRYGFHEEGQTSKMKNDVEHWQRSGEYLHFIPDEDIVGIDEYKDILIGELTDERPERVVVAVVGMGGLGKTTLVTKVYDSPEVKNHFECHAWITVSQSYKVDELMRNMIKELYKSNKEAVPDSINKMEGGHLVQAVIEYLQNKRPGCPCRHCSAPGASGGDRSGSSRRIDRMESAGYI